MADSERGEKKAELTGAYLCQLKGKDKKKT